jgi:hypothetical protein
VIRVTWGKLRAGAWDEFERTYRNVITNGKNVKGRTDVALEKFDDRLGEGIILVARHHVGGASDVDQFRARNLREELLHPLLSHHIN